MIFKRIIKLNRIQLFIQILRHKFMRKNFDFDIIEPINIYKVKKSLNLLFYPKKFLMNYSVFKLLRFIKHFFIFKKKNDDRFTLSLWKSRPKLSDWNSSHPYDRHYIYHTSWAARRLYKATPEKHIDISSDIRFSSFISVFTSTEFYDIRKVELILSGLSTNRANLLELPFESESVESLSCMHVVEHCGLGRYGDIVNPRSDLKAMEELQRVLSPGGKLFFVVPIAGKPRIEFNIHRVYSHDQILSIFSNLKLEEFTLIPDSPKFGDLVESPSKNMLNLQKYACGCYIFTK